jgi:hypothetical protein
MNKEELKLLFKTEKSYPKVIKIDDILVETLEEFDWFGYTEKKDLLIKYDINLKKDIDKYNMKISNAKNKLFDELRKISNERNLSEGIVNMLIRTGEFILQPNNFCYYKNPLGLYKYDDANGDISCDSSSGYDGEEGRMDCWILEENSRTSCSEVSLADVFEINTWSTKESNNKLMDMILIAQIFCDIGFDVYYFSIKYWRKGYDFTAHSFEPNNPDKILNLTSNDEEYFRIYIDKNYIDKNYIDKNLYL